MILVFERANTLRPYRPHSVVVGLRILLASLAIGLGDLVISTLWGADYLKTSDRVIFAAMWVAVTVLVGAIYVALLIRAGRRSPWARNLLAAWFLASVALHIYIVVDVGPAVGPAAAVEYGTTLLDSIGIALLFSRDSRAWYRSPNVAESALRRQDVTVRVG